jgi:hypothetical protein
LLEVLTFLLTEGRRQVRRKCGGAVSRALIEEQEKKLFKTASSNTQWELPEGGVPEQTLMAIAGHVSKKEMLEQLLTYLACRQSARQLLHLCQLTQRPRKGRV